MYFMPGSRPDNFNFSAPTEFAATMARFHEFRSPREYSTLRILDNGIVETNFTMADVDVVAATIGVDCTTDVVEMVVDVDVDVVDGIVDSAVTTNVVDGAGVVVVVGATGATYENIPTPESN